MHSANISGEWFMDGALTNMGELGWWHVSGLGLAFAEI